MPPHLPISLSYLRLITDPRTPVNAILTKKDIENPYATECSMVVMHLIISLYKDLC